MNEFILIMPELFLALTLIFVIIGEITYFGERVRLVAATAITGLVGTFIQTVISYQYGATQVFAHSFSVDGLSLFFKLLFVTLGILAIITATQTREIPESRRSEYCALIVASCLAMCIASAAADVLLSFVALLFVNILGFFLAGYGKKSLRSTEAAVKYMSFSIVSSSLLLYGLAILFGWTHTLNIYEVHKLLVANPLSREITLVIFMLMFLSFCFQFAAFPLHFWAPDVLEGAPTPVSAFISFGTRAAGFAVAIRLLLVLFAKQDAGQWGPLGDVDWPQIVALVSSLTMLSGALLAYKQTSAKRLVAYLVVAESGFLLLGLLVLDEVGIAALLYNLVADLFSLIGIYYVLSFLFDELGSDQLDDMRGVLAHAVPECICLVLFLLSFVGLPPLPGFIGKFALIGAAIRHHWWMLALISIVSITLSITAMSRLAYSLMGDFRQPVSKAFEIGIVPRLERRIFLAGLMFPMVLVGVFAEFFLNWAGKSLGFIFW